MKTYLVTGASRGIGLAVTNSLLKRGNKVIGTFNSGSEAAQKMMSNNKNLTMLQSDFADTDSLKTLVDSIADTPLYGIVNSAGVFSEVELDAINMDAFERNFKINTFAPVFLVGRLSKNLVADASVVNIATTDTEVGSESGMGYAASKAAVLSVTKSMALSLASKGMRVNAISPGWIGDGMQAPDELLAIAKNYNPMNKLGAYDEIAGVVTFLLSDDASYVNGTNIVADGGDSVKSYVLDQETKLL